MGKNKTISNLLRHPCAIFLTLFLFSHDSSAQAQHEIGPFKVEWNNARLSIIAVEVPLFSVLQEVSRQTKVNIQGLENLHEPITVRFSRLPLDEGLKNLLDNVNYAIFTKLTPHSNSPSTRMLITGRRDISPFKSITAGEIKSNDGLLDNDFQSPGPNISLSKIQELCEINHPQIEDILYSATHDPDPSIREIAYRHLYERKGKKGSDALLTDAKSPDDDIRKTAVSLLGELLGSDAAEILRDTTEDNNIEIRYLAFQQLSQITSNEGLAVLRARLIHPDPEIRIMALEAMASKGEEFALEAARSTFGDSDELVRSKAEGFMHESEARKEVENEQ